ncbi:MAG: SDR family oxidoreductase [Acidimicrobiia bacterium]|nr:SDR family oxidoreductase [Acidimicrobiia bacterium]
MRLPDKITLITGAGAGLGRECALLFAEQGAAVVATDVDGDRADATAAAIVAAGGAASALAVDVTDEQQVAGAVATTVERHGRLDVLFNNAGIQVPGFPSTRFEDFTEQQWRRTLDVNLTGVFFGCKHAVAPMRANGGGSIIVTSSAVSLASARNLAPYAASKGGVNALVRSLAVDLGADGIRVNAIAPLHGMSTNFFTGPGSEVTGLSMEEARGPWDPMASGMPLKLDRAPSLRDNALAALFLASDESAYISGVCLPTTDGGVLGGLYLER